jgi:hypothetical protein
MASEALRTVSVGFREDVDAVRLEVTEREPPRAHEDWRSKHQ